MVRREVCPKCKAECQYDTRSVVEGNRELEEYVCPVCGYVLDTAFTDQIPVVTLIKKGKKE